MRDTRPDPLVSAKWDLESTARSHAAASLRARYWPEREGVQVLVLAKRLEINARTYARLCTPPLLPARFLQGSRAELFQAADIFAAAYLSGFNEQDAAAGLYLAARYYARDVKERKPTTHDEPTPSASWSTARIVRAKADFALLCAVTFGEAANDPEVSSDEFHDEAIALEKGARDYARAYREHGEAASLSHLPVRERETATAFLVTCVEYDRTTRETDADAWQAAAIELERTAKEHYAVVSTSPEGVET